MNFKIKPSTGEDGFEIKLQSVPLKSEVVRIIGTPNNKNYRVTEIVHTPSLILLYCDLVDSSSQEIW